MKDNTCPDILRRYLTFTCKSPPFRATIFVSDTPAVSPSLRTRGNAIDGRKLVWWLSEPTSQKSGRSTPIKTIWWVPQQTRWLTQCYMFRGSSHESCIGPGVSSIWECWQSFLNRYGPCRGIRNVFSEDDRSVTEHTIQYNKGCRNVCSLDPVLSREFGDISPEFGDFPDISYLFIGRSTLMGLLSIFGLIYIFRPIPSRICVMI